MDKLDPELSSESDGSSVVQRIGFVVAGGVIAALGSSLPAALRTGDASPSRALEQWLVLSAFATPLAVAAVAILRRARVGVRILAGDRAQALAMGVLWWGVIELALLAIFGAVLRKTTHHQALAGVTFTAFAVISGALVALFAGRTTTLLARSGPGLQKVGLALAGASAFIVIILVGVRTSRAEEIHTAAALVDALAFAVASTIASSRLLMRLRSMAIAGVPVAVLVIVVGLTMLRFDPSLRTALIESAPVHSVVLGLFGP